MFDGLNWTAAHKQSHSICLQPKESTKETISLFAFIQCINDDKRLMTKLPHNTRQQGRKMCDIFEHCVTFKCLFGQLVQFMNDLRSSRFDFAVMVLMQ